MLRSTAIALSLAANLLLPAQLPAASVPAPDFTLSGPQGGVELQKYRGRVVYLDFWASWCTPCRKSFPWMNTLQQRYADDGLVVLAINLDQDTAAARRFLDKYPASFTVAFDPDGSVAERYDLKGMPSSYLIDRQGKLVMSHVGFRTSDADRLEARIKAQLEH
ncbi:MAG: TlpA disulfide reductase family protein [Thiohalophilus sp.]|uniref:TlpA family protein disulfide reductase n=1 Tax=Thiohalophilus sp. TaxID=3028392 RepID=UPI002870442E|nr:TlpA disulfide reductase family protein [Thiohalophilus sp.]MDR9436758.1 TlpA disulfide reductase family protein [Thiohalophilus sp.]